jgi:hypothetical protein
LKKLYISVDASVIGGCEDSEFADASLALWKLFVEGFYIQVLSEHTLRELRGAPESIRARLLETPEANQVILPDTSEAEALAEAYLTHGIVGPGGMPLMWPLPP